MSPCDKKIGQLRADFNLFLRTLEYSFKFLKKKKERKKKGKRKEKKKKLHSQKTQVLNFSSNQGLIIARAHGAHTPKRQLLGVPKSSL